MLLFRVGRETVSSGREGRILAGRNFRSHNTEITDPENSTAVAVSLQRVCALQWSVPHWSFPLLMDGLRNHGATSSIDYSVWLCSTTHK